MKKAHEIKENDYEIPNYNIYNNIFNFIAKMKLSFFHKCHILYHTLCQVQLDVEEGLNT